MLRGMRLLWAVSSRSFDRHERHFRTRLRAICIEREQLGSVSWANRAGKRSSRVSLVMWRTVNAVYTGPVTLVSAKSRAKLNNVYTSPFVLKVI